MPDPAGGARASLAGMVALLTRPFRAGKAPTNTQDDLTQFNPIFQPDGGNFSPGIPLAPPQREPLRAWNYPFSYNTVYTPRSYENVSFEELRALAENYDILRLAIETRKDQIERQHWIIKSRDDYDVATDAQDRIKKLTEFWRHPDDYQPFAGWLRELLEDALVLDAATLEIRRNRANEIIGLDVIDGSTIKVLLDYNGRTPRPPAPAYEQIIHGRPWSLVQDGQRTNEENADDPPRFTDSELIYLPRNRRAHKAYGFSAVEQIIITVNIGLRRQISQLNEFTDGNMPPGMVTAPPGWNPDHIQQFQDWFDSMLSGNLANKRKLLWGPDGAKYQRFFEPPLKDEFDEWLARIVCYAFSLPVVPFTKTQNRGEEKSVKETSTEDGLAPLKAWVKRLIDSVIQRRMGHQDLEFSWSDIEAVDPVDQAKITDIKLHSGRLTLNEARDLDGMDPVDGGDHVMFFTPSGPLLLQAIVGGTGKPRDLIGIDTDPADTEGPPTPDEQPGAIPDAGTPAPDPPHPGHPGDAANPRKDPNAGDEEVRASKASRPFVRRARLATAPGRNAALLRRTEAHLTRRLHSFFEGRAKHVAAQIAAALKPHRAASDPQARARAILTQIDLGDWSPAGSHISESIPPIYSDGYRRALQLVGYRTGAETINQARANLGRKPVAHGDVSPFGRPQRLARATEPPKDLDTEIDADDEETALETGVSADLINERAVAWAKAHATALVTDISENTRDMLQSTVAEAIQEGWSAAELATAIRDNVGFSEARAATIARTELINAYGKSTIDGYRASGVVEYKEWLTGDDPCDDCQANEGAGAIPIDDDFPSGDDAPAAHPRCVCTLVAAFPDEGEE